MLKNEFVWVTNRRGGNKVLKRVDEIQGDHSLGVAKKGMLN